MDRGLQIMQEGAKYRFFIPTRWPRRAGAGQSLPPFATLIFDVVLVKVK
jgi:FKBP-type peptidyl-prolyl cis-trans isomerase FklB